MKFIKKLLYLLPLISLTFITGYKKEENIKIGIVQIVKHESLDNAKQGFIYELKNLGYENIDFDF